MLDIKIVKEKFEILCEASKKYFDRGWEIFPCILYMKIKITNEGVFRKKFMFSLGSWKQKIFTREQFRDDGHELIQRRGGFNALALKTGPSKILVVDVDKKGNFDNSIFLIRSLMMNVNPVFARTQSGGFHYYFNAPAGCRKMSLPKLGIDIQCRDSLVYLPPSSVLYGGQYTWIKPPETRLPDMPDELYTYLYSKPDTPTRRITGPTRTISGLTLSQRQILVKRIQECVSCPDGYRSERDFALLGWMKKLNLDPIECKKICQKIGRKFLRGDYFDRAWDKLNRNIEILR